LARDDEPRAARAQKENAHHNKTRVRTRM